MLIIADFGTAGRCRRPPDGSCLPATLLPRPGSHRSCLSYRHTAVERTRVEPFKPLWDQTLGMCLWKGTAVPFEGSVVSHSELVGHSPGGQSRLRNSCPQAPASRYPGRRA